MADLLQKLSEAKEGSRELDAEIAAETWINAKVSKTRPWLVTQNGINREPPRYSTSLDAALTLKPDKHRLRLWEHHSGSCGCDLFPENGGVLFKAHAPTLALAVVIAALKSRVGR